VFRMVLHHPYYNLQGHQKLAHPSGRFVCHVLTLFLRRIFSSHIFEHFTVILTVLHPGRQRMPQKFIISGRFRDGNNHLFSNQNQRFLVNFRTPRRTLRLHVEDVVIPTDISAGTRVLLTTLLCVVES